jgi:hypothetical protein
MENKKRRKSYKPKKFDYEHQYEPKCVEGCGAGLWKFEDIITDEQKTIMYALANGYKVDKKSIKGK